MTKFKLFLFIILVCILGNDVCTEKVYGSEINSSEEIMISVYLYGDRDHNTPFPGDPYVGSQATLQVDSSTLNTDWATFEKQIYEKFSEKIQSTYPSINIYDEWATYYQETLNFFGLNVPVRFMGIYSGQDSNYQLMQDMATVQQYKHVTFLYAPYMEVDHVRINSSISLAEKEFYPMLVSPEDYTEIKWNEVMHYKGDVPGSWISRVPKEIEGYEFLDFSHEINQISNINSILPSQSNKIFALYSPVKKFSISYDSMGGTSVSSEQVKENDFFTEPAAPTKAGYEFGGWYIDKDLMERYDFNTRATQDIKVYAKWNEKVIPETNTYTIEYNPTGGTAVQSETVRENETFTEPVAPTKAGYEFIGWYIDESLIERYDFKTIATKDITVYAKWNEKVMPETNTYTIEYNSTGGTTVQSETVRENETFTEPAAPTKAGYKFDGWYIDENLIERYDFKTKATKDIIVHAKWIPLLTNEDKILTIPKQETQRKLQSVNDVSLSKSNRVPQKLPRTGEKRSSVLFSLVGYSILFVLGKSFLVRYFFTKGDLLNNFKK